MFRRISLIWLSIALSTTSAVQSDIVNIDFDDGTGAGMEIGNFYDSLGVSFSDAQWGSEFDGRPGTSSSFQIDSLSTPQFPKSNSPITATFSVLVDMVSISAIDVGFNDARLDAYDQLVGGNLIGSSTYEGLSLLGNTFTNIDTGVLTVSGNGIRRIEIYQPNSSVSNDGVSFDNLSYNVVPEPASIPLMVTFFVVGTMLQRRRKLQEQLSPNLANSTTTESHLKEEVRLAQRCN